MEKSDELHINLIPIILFMVFHCISCCRMVLQKMEYYENCITFVGYGKRLCRDRHPLSGYS